MKVNALFDKHGCFPSYNLSQIFRQINHSVSLPSALFVTVSEHLKISHDIYIKSKHRLYETVDIKQIHNNYYQQKLW